jgi:hypothetical protein
MTRSGYVTGHRGVPSGGVCPGFDRSLPETPLLARVLRGAIVILVIVVDRVRLPLDRLWVVLLYPAAWLVVVLLRGATDGWVPYPFHEPAEGYAAVAGYCLVILLAFLVVGAFLFWCSGIGRRIVSQTAS